MVKGVKINPAVQQGTPEKRRGDREREADDTKHWHLDLYRGRSRVSVQVHRNHRSSEEDDFERIKIHNPACKKDSTRKVNDDEPSKR